MKPSHSEAPAKRRAARIAAVTAVVGTAVALSVVFVLHTTSRRVTRELENVTPFFTPQPSAAPAQQSTAGIPDPRTTTAAPTEPASTKSDPTEVPSVSAAETATAAATTAPPQTAQAVKPIENDAFLSPVEGAAVLKPFSPRQPLFSATMGDWRIHNGVDFAAEDGAEVHAVGNGVVRQITADARLGYVVEIDHGSFAARYCSLNQDGAVKNGSTVAAGDVIGTLATPPNEQEDAPHLHFETLRDGAFIDPLEALNLQ